MHSLERTQRIDASLERVFPFFSDPANLARITPPWLSFRIAGDPPLPIVEGCRVEYRIRWMLFRLRWVTRITRWNPPSGFQDAQEKGPYRTWIHTHTFRPAGGGVEMSDRVDYELPFGPLGRIAHALLVRRQLRKIFDFRATAIEEIFGKNDPLAAAG
jgi:ligand-binding SRPBCC domain-containing protein